MVAVHPGSRSTRRTTPPTVPLGMPRNCAPGGFTGFSRVEVLEHLALLRLDLAQLLVVRVEQRPRADAVGLGLRLDRGLVSRLYSESAGSAL